jgi:hypothetical protein
MKEGIEGVVGEAKRLKNEMKVMESKRCHINASFK